MEIITHIAKVSACLFTIWMLALSIGLAFQLNQVRRNWIEGTRTPIKTNPVLDRILKALGLDHGDRLVHSINLTSAVLIWPVSLIFGYPVLAAIRAKERNRVKKLQQEQSEQINRIPNQSVDEVQAADEISRVAVS